MLMTVDPLCLRPLLKLMVEVTPDKSARLVIEKEVAKFVAEEEAKLQRRQSEAFG